MSFFFFCFNSSFKILMSTILLILLGKSFHRVHLRYANDLLPNPLTFGSEKHQFSLNLVPYEPGHEKTYLMSYANNKSADQPAHPRSLITAFIVHCLDSISLDSIAEISRVYLASLAAQTGLCLAWSETSEDTFCRVVAHMNARGSWPSWFMDL